MSDHDLERITKELRALGQKIEAHYEGANKSLTALNEALIRIADAIEDLADNIREGNKA